LIFNFLDQIKITVDEWLILEGGRILEHYF